MKSIICVGPISGPPTGQQIAFKTFVDNYHGDISVIDTNSLNKNKIKYTYDMLCGILRFLILISSSKYQVCYITTSRSKFGFFKDSIFIGLANLFNLKVVNHLHGSDFLFFRENFFAKNFLDYIYKKIEHHIVLSDSMVEQYEFYDNSNISVVPNFITTSLDSIPDEKYPIKIDKFDEKNPLKVLYLSNIMASKGFFYLFEAVKNLNENGAHIKLIVAGKLIPDSFMGINELHSEFSRVSSFEFVDYKGIVSGAEKEDLLNESNVLALPTFYPTEAQPLSIIEGMAHGCVILTTNHNYLNDLVSKENGYIVNVKSSYEIEVSFNDLYKNVTYLYAIEKINKKYSYENYKKEKYIENVTNIIDEYL